MGCIPISSLTNGIKSLAASVMANGEFRAPFIDVRSILPGLEETFAHDIRRLYDEGLISAVMFLTMQTPEGNPPVDKFTPFAESFRKLQELLRDCDIPIGINAHIMGGWQPSVSTNFTRITRGDSGKTPTYNFCPLGSEFQEYTEKIFTQLATLSPSFFLIDDDVRLITEHYYCYCEKHISLFNSRHGLSYTREALKAEVDTFGELAQAWDNWQRESLVSYVTLIRRSIDSVSSGIPCYFCTCGFDISMAADIARALAAPQQTPVVRLSDAVYLNDSLRSLPRKNLITATQLAALPSDIEVWTEGDTFPQNRRSTSAQMIHAHNSLSLLLGCKAVKSWVTELADPSMANGKAYRNKMRANRGFYLELSRFKPEWEGLAIPVCGPTNDILRNRPASITWGSDYAAFEGIPFSYEFDIDKVQLANRRIALTASNISLVIQKFNNAEIEKMLSGKVLLDGSAAIELTKYGFSELIGSQAIHYNDSKGRIMLEELADGSLHDFSLGAQAAEIFDLDQKADVRSTFYHTKGAEVDSEGRVKLFPGSYRFKNKLGGDIFVVASRIISFPNGFGGYAAFGAFLRNWRRDWLAAELDLGLRTDEDAPVMLWSFKHNDQRHLVLVNLGLDILDGVSLKNAPGGEIEQLQGNGSWGRGSFEEGRINFPFNPGDVAIFRFSSPPTQARES